jgi:hypothetical protein
VAWGASMKQIFMTQWRLVPNKHFINMPTLQLHFPLASPCRNMELGAILNETQKLLQEVKSDPTPLTLPGGMEQDKDFYFTDGNVHLLVRNQVNMKTASSADCAQVNKQVFFVHRFKLAEFRGIELKLRVEPGSAGVLELPGDPNDFRNTFKLIYASYVPHICSFVRLLMV